MDTLVSCTCGHTLADHDGGGCRGERLRPCPCERDRSGALDAAVRAARSRPPAAYAAFGGDRFAERRLEASGASGRDRLTAL